jgi:phospholipid/cholesterol/gamma-HCH transport system substrate-binding protein
MDKETSRIIKRTGIFVVSATLILIVLLGIVISKQRLFVKKHSFFTVLNDTYGLDESVTVNFKGQVIGRVQDFAFNQANDIEVTFFIYDDFMDRVTEGSVISKSVHSLTGKGTLEFFTGIPGAGLLEEDSLIPSSDMEEGKRIFSERRIRMRGDPVTMMLNDISDFFDNLKRDDNIDQGSLFRLIYNTAQSMETLDQTLSYFNEIVISLRSENYQDNGVLMRLIGNLAELTEEFKVTNSLIAANMIEMNTLLANYSQPEGLLKKMIDPSEELFIEPLGESLKMLNENMKQLRELLDFISSQKPEISILMSESIKSLSEMQKTLEGVNNHPLIRGGIQQEAAPVTGERIRPLDTE